MNRVNGFRAHSLPQVEGALVYRTEQDGAVTISSEGRKLWIETER